eukprot:521537-Amphidinium_carterae.1
MRLIVAWGVRMKKRFTERLSFSSTDVATAWTKRGTKSLEKAPWSSSQAGLSPVFFPTCWT